MPAPRPELSFLVVTDSYATTAGVVEHLRRQTLAARIELVLVCPDRERLGLPDDAAEGLARIAVVEHPLQPLSEARAAGLRQATADTVYLGETHVFPHPDWAERLLAARERGGFAAVVPCIRPANPGSAFGRSALLLDYGEWSGGVSGPLRRAPGSNIAVTRRLLLERPEPAERLLEPINLSQLLRRSGGIYHAADARIDHLNVVRLRAWLDERYLGGRLIAGARSGSWSGLRRLLFALATPLIWLVVLRRVLAALPADERQPRLVLLVALGAAVQTAGEAMGYLGASLPEAQRRMEAYEIFKARYA